MPQPKGYTLTQIVLHWTIFLLVSFQLIFGDAMTDAYRVWLRNGTFTPSFGVAAHVIVGIAVLVLVLPRLLIKVRRGAPPLPENEPASFKLAGNLTHLALYTLLFLLPISGLVAWFGGQGWAGQVHELLKPLTILLVLAHVAGALYQHYVLKSNVLTRMMKREA